MKKTVLQSRIPLCGTLLILVILFGLSFKLVRAQELSSERAYQDYQYNLTQYNQAYSDYQDAKNSFLLNQTLSLKEEARQKTLAMLMARDQLMIVYLTALRTKIVESPGLSSDDKGAIFTKIDSEVSWYQNHKTNYKDGDSLDDLFAKNDEAKNRYKTNTSLVTGETIFDISLGAEMGARTDQENIYNKLKSIIDDGVTSGKLTRSPFNHWLTDIDATIQTLKQNEDMARKAVQKIFSQSYFSTGSFTTSMDILNSSIKPLLQFNQFLTEVLNYIKNQQ